MKCQCGNTRFIGHQLIRADVITDEHGEFAENLPQGLDASIYDAEAPYGPFTCTVCDREYEELVDEKNAL